jgi:Tfp pilus assembly protein PilX
VQILSFILLTLLALLVCNLIYCGQRITADVRHILGTPR